MPAQPTVVIEEVLGRSTQGMTRPFICRGDDGEIYYVKGLTSEVKGTLKTFVGAQVIASDDRRFRFTWTYRGLRLALAGFAQLPTDDKPKESQ